MIDFKKLTNWRTYAHKKYIPWAIAGVLILTLTALMSIYHTQIVHWLTPVANWMHSLKFGWLIPIAILFVISFPPLFGHEIVAIICGLVWGLWIGFAIVAAGTLIGEIGNFYAFKFCLSERGHKLEKTKLSYACLARVVREGGFKIALIARLSAVPGHFTTAVFSTCGMGFFTFTLAALLSMPKQFITVYLGVILEQSSETPAEQAKNKTSRIISDVVLVITFLITFAACWYIWREMEKVKPAVLKERRLAKKKLMATSSETQALSRDSNADLASNDDHTDNGFVKPNEGVWGRGGGYGYNGIGNQSEDTISAPFPQKAKAPVDRWEMSETSNDNPIHAYPPSTRDDPYQQGPGANAPPHQSSYDEAAVYHHSKVPAQAPQINDVPNLTGPRRTGRDGWETSEASTVGMGSWGGILHEGSESDPSQGPGGYPQSYPATAHQLHPSMVPGSGNQSQQQDFQRPQHIGGPNAPNAPGISNSRSQDLAELGVLNGQPGLSAFGAPMGGGDTVMVTPRSVPGERQSAEMKGPGAGHALNRSMRATVEDSDLAYTQDHDYTQYDPYQQQQQQQHSVPPGAAAPVQPGSFSYHTARDQEASHDTFGQPASSVH